MRTPEAVEYQLQRHPLGPVRLADAMCRAPAASIADSSTDRASTAFCLIETALMLAHAGQRLHRMKQTGEADHRHCFRRAVKQVLRQAEGVLGRDTTEPVDQERAVGSLLRYRAAVETLSAQLLGTGPAGRVLMQIINASRDLQENLPSPRGFEG